MAAIARSRPRTETSAFLALAGAYQRLSVLDAAFLGLETKSAGMHVALAGVFEGGALVGEDGVVDVDAIRRTVLASLHRIPRYRQKLKHTPLERLPVWVDDENFAIEDHVARVAAPQPGGPRELKEVAAQLLREPLRRDRPLWELRLVDGLEGGHFALFAKVHHCMVDGVSGVELMATLLSGQPSPTIASPVPFEPRRAPSAAVLGFADSVRRGALTWKGWTGAMQGWARLSGEPAARILEKLDGDARSERGPGGSPLAALGKLKPATATSFNRPIGPRRRVDWVRMDLEEVKSVGKVLGGSLNDVVLTTVSGAVREYLHRQGTDPAGLDFRVMVPVNLRGEDERGQLGNRISAWLVELPLSEPDPRRAFREVAAQTARLRKSDAGSFSRLLERVGDWLPVPLRDLGARHVTKLRPVNMVVTNVPGPPVPLYLGASRLLEGVPMVPLHDNLGLGVALLSYDGTLQWGLVADPELVPDLGAFASLIPVGFAALAELR